MGLRHTLYKNRSMIKLYIHGTIMVSQYAIGNINNNFNVKYLLKYSFISIVITNSIKL